MKRFLLFCARALVIVIASLAALFVYFVYTPAPELPPLSGQLSSDSIDVAGTQRSYTRYVPAQLRKGAALVLVLHGSGEGAGQMRRETGYAFERLADRHGFAVVYPNALEGLWNACSIVGAVGAHGRAADDVAFLTQLVDRLAAQLPIDANRVFATGSSRGGSMVLRLALEAPSRFRAVAAVSASVPTPDNFQCTSGAQGTSSVMIMNGTQDPLMPFEGGEVSLFGLLYRNGTVRSSRDSGQYFADLNHLIGAPEIQQTPLADGVRVEQFRWPGAGRIEVELVAVHGAGHGMPQPYRRRPRLLGPSPTVPNGPELIWVFFERQH